MLLYPARLAAFQKNKQTLRYSPHNGSRVMDSLDEATPRSSTLLSLQPDKMTENSENAQPRNTLPVDIEDFTCPTAPGVLKF